MEVVKALALVFDWTLGHFVTGCGVGASGPADVGMQRRGDGSDAVAASDRDRKDASGRSRVALGALWTRSDGAPRTPGHDRIDASGC